MSLPGLVVGMPGMRTAVEATPRIVFKGQYEWHLPGGKIIAGECARDPGNTGDVTNLRAGLLMGKISSAVNSLGLAGNYANSILGVTTNAEAAGSTAIEAAAAVVTELVRRCGATGTFWLVGPPSASGIVAEELVTYSAASSTNITVTAITNAFVAGSLIMPTDGSQDFVTLIPDGYPMPVVNFSGDSVQVPFPRMPTAGHIISSQIINWPADASLKAWIVATMSSQGYGKFIWDHLY